MATRKPSSAALTQRSAWEAARRAERYYQTKLVGVARQVGEIIDGLAPGGIVTDLQIILKTLERYADLITPWATATATRMIADVDRRGERAWRRLSAAIGRSIREEIATSSQGAHMKAMLEENVILIRSLPLEAGQRVHKLTTEALVTGRRAESIAKEVQASGHVSKSRARLIARTEVSRTQAMFVQARAQKAGSEGYIWRTSKDADVRLTHQAQEGRYIRWGQPPKTDKGLDPYHAGCGPNCRCWMEVVFPDD